MSILAVSGDVGGARALMPVLEELSTSGEKFSIIDHGFLAKEGSDKWERIQIDLSDEDPIEKMLKENQYDVVIWTTCVKDIVPLRVARIAKNLNIPTICLLDNWMNYKQRMGIDGNPSFEPDMYLIMDKLAYDEACSDGISQSILKVTGQPALASLADDYNKWDDKKRNEIIASYGLNKDKRILTFISEPAEDDQGSDSSSETFRGYTEKTVLKELCEKLQEYSKEYQLIIAPHPRENVEEVKKLWDELKENLEGSVIKFPSGRDVIFLADAVAGMVSILLYEAWLINKPVISLQPELCDPQLNVMKKRQGMHCVTNNDEMSEAIKEWINEINTEKRPGVRQDLDLHATAAKNISELVKSQLIKR